MEEKDEQSPQVEVDALCRECGHAFKAYVDRLLHADKTGEGMEAIICPVCGCGKCQIH